MPPGLTTAASIARLTQAIDQYAEVHADSPVPLDLRMEMRPEWGAVFANLLAGKHAALPFAVQFPTLGKQQLQQARASVFFALSRHQRATFNSRADEYIIDPWRYDWEPSDIEQPLFRIEDVDDTPGPKSMAKELLAYLNPERFPRSRSADDRESVVRPWLSKLINRPDVEYREWRHQFYRDVSLSSMELLDNIRDHAKLDDYDLCSLSLFTTTGGVGGAHDKLYLSVWDNGCGMPSSVAQHFDEAVPHATRIESAFNGAMPHRQADRGRGLNRITNLVNRVGGHLFAATGPTPAGSIVIDHAGAPGAAVEAMVQDLPVQGTVVVMTLPLKPKALVDRASEA